MDVGEPIEQPLGRGEHLVARDRDAEHALQHRPAELRHPSSDRRDALDPPAARVGQRQEPERLAGRRRIDHDHVVVAGVDVVADPEEVAELVHPGQDGHLLGHDLVEAAPREELATRSSGSSASSGRCCSRRRVPGRRGSARSASAPGRAARRTRRRGCGRCRSRGRSSGGRDRRRGVRSRQRCSSSRRHPCRCTGGFGSSVTPVRGESPTIVPRGRRNRPSGFRQDAADGR